ncbi:MAG: hypothetical protein EON54_20690 [Alcaligenaceae bacterium]|nr:MAG: hypothetical protein EON54_20690 [Alcaligenaceae bacterium]
MAHPLQLQRHRWLHSDGQRLITSWFERAWSERLSEQATFEAFVFAWMSVNAWAACVTDEDQDREFMRRLTEDRGLRHSFEQIVNSHPEVRRDAEEFVSLLPIFKAQRLRRADVHGHEDMTRGELVKHYLAAGMTDFAPECSKWHRERGEPVPCDWPHFIAATYRVRCNLFHGEKSAHSEMDRRIVRAALLTLTGFFRAANIL